MVEIRHRTKEEWHALWAELRAGRIPPRVGDMVQMTLDPMGSTGLVVEVKHIVLGRDHPALFYTIKTANGRTYPTYRFDNFREDIRFVAPREWGDKRFEFPMTLLKVGDSYVNMDFVQAITADPTNRKVTFFLANAPDMEFDGDQAEAVLNTLRRWSTDAIRDYELDKKEAEEEAKAAAQVEAAVKKTAPKKSKSNRKKQEEEDSAN